MSGARAGRRPGAGRRATVPTASLALALAALIAAGVPADSPASEPAREATASEKSPSRLLVTADEWSLVLSRTTLRRGPAIVELYNRGEDPHDLRIRRADRRGPTGMLAKVEPGRGGRLEFRLRRGKRYRLWCSLPNHRERGMRATLKVRRRR